MGAFDSLAPAKLALSDFPSVSLASPPLRCAKRLASRRDALQFPQTADATMEQRTRRLCLRLIFRRGRDGFVFAIRL